MIDFVVLDLPYPTSANAMYRIDRQFGTLYKSTEYKKYIEAVHDRWLFVRERGAVDFSDEILLGIIRFPRRKGCDSDNIQKTLQDSLESIKPDGMKPGFRGAFDNDNKIVGDRKECGQRVQEGFVRVFLCAEARRRDFEEVFSREARIAIVGRKKDAGRVAPAPDSFIVKVFD